MILDLLLHKSRLKFYFNYQDQQVQNNKKLTKAQEDHLQLENVKEEFLKKYGNLRLQSDNPFETVEFLDIQSQDPEANNSQIGSILHNSILLPQRTPIIKNAAPQIPLNSLQIERPQIPPDIQNSRERKSSELRYFSYKIMDNLYDFLCYIPDLNFVLSVSELIYNKIHIDVIRDYFP